MHLPESGKSVAEIGQKCRKKAIKKHGKGLATKKALC